MLGRPRVTLIVTPSSQVGYTKNGAPQKLLLHQTHPEDGTESLNPILATASDSYCWWQPEIPKANHRLDGAF